MENHPFKTVCCGDCGELIRVPVYCGDRLCTTCSRSRAFRIRDRLESFFKTVKLQQGEMYVHCVLTVKNQKSLAPMLRFLVRSFRTLRNRKMWRHYFSGGAFVIEVTGSPDNWHAHLHIVGQSVCIPQRRLLDNWREIVGTGGVFIKKIPLQAAARYLTKYVTKPTDSDSHAAQISEGLSNVRMFQPFGSWFGAIKKYVKPSFPCPNCGCLVWKVYNYVEPLPSSHDPPPPGGYRRTPSQERKFLKALQTGFTYSLII